MPTEIDKLPTIHIVGNDGVTYVNVYRRSLSSGPNTSILAYSSNRGPQGLRRPRFSFFIFTCQTARDPRIPLSRAESSDTLHSTANHNRLVSAVESLIKVRSIKGANACLGLVGQCSAALSGRVISSPDRPCQRPLSTNRRIRWRFLQRAKILAFSGSYAVLEPQSCDVLTIRQHRIAGCQWKVGAAGNSTRNR